MDNFIEVVLVLKKELLSAIKIAIFMGQDYIIIYLQRHFLCPLNSNSDFTMIATNQYAIRFF